MWLSGPCPSFVYTQDQSLDVPGLGTIQVDTVCVGGFFVMVDAEKAGLDFSPEKRADLIPLGMRIIDEANRQLSVRHPERPEVSTVDVVEFYRQTRTARGRAWWSTANPIWTVVRAVRAPRPRRP